MIVLDMLSCPHRAGARVRDTEREVRRLSAYGSTGDRHGTARRGRDRPARRSRGRGAIREGAIGDEAGYLR
jgi:hypothetical protein